MTFYIAIIHKDNDSDYGVSFPDFPGCITAGSNLEEARSMAEEALQGHTELMLEEVGELPEPSSLDNVMANEDYADGVAILVELKTQRKLSRINITMDEQLIKTIDMNTKNRSAFLAEAARQYLRENDMRNS